MNSDQIANDNQPTNDEQIIKEYAGFWVRFVALIIDNIIFLIIFGILYFGTLFLFSPVGFDLFFYQQVFSNSEYDSYFNFGDFVQIILPLLLTVWFWRRFKATPGKMAFKLEVVDADSGETPSIGQCAGRYLAYFISTIPLFLGFIWAAFDKRKQGWHDKLANTVVIKKRAAPVKFIADA